MARRNPGDPHQLRIAVHEIAHGYAWDSLGLDVRSVRHWGDSGETHVRWSDDQWRPYAIGLWAGYEAEKLWSGSASRGNSAWDIKRFRQVTRGNGFSEGAARSEARSLVRRHIGRIEAAAPELIRAGRLTRL
jgi:hypothetical protein